MGIRLFEPNDDDNNRINLPDAAPPVPKKRGRKTNAEKAAMAAAAAKIPAARNWLEPGADAESAQKLAIMPEAFTGMQPLVEIAVDETTSTSLFDGDIRSGAAAMSTGLGSNPVAKACVTVGLLGFNTACRVRSFTRGGFTLPEHIEYVSGTFLAPLLDKTAAVAKAFSAHVAAKGGVKAEGMVVVVSDFHFNDWPHARLKEWKAFMAANGMAVVSAMVGQFNCDAAAEISNPLPPVPVAKVSFEALFSTLTTSLATSLAGRARLVDLLREEFAKLL